MQPSSHPWRENAAPANAGQRDYFITSTEAKAIGGGVSDMTLWRWQRAGIIPAPLKIRGRNYWRRGEFIRALEAAAS